MYRNHRFAFRRFGYDQVNQCVPSKFVHAQANTSGERYTDVINVTIYTAQISNETLSKSLPVQNHIYLLFKIMVNSCGMYITNKLPKVYFIRSVSKRI